MCLRTVLIFVLMAGAAGAAELKIGSGLLNAGSPAAVEITLDAAGETIAALQFDVEYDPAVLQVSLEAGSAAVDAVKGVQSASIGSGRLRAVILGNNQNSMANGTVAVLKVTLTGKADPGRSYPIRLTAPSGATGTGKAVTIAGRDGALTIAAGKRRIR